MNIEEANNLNFPQLMYDLNFTPVQGKGRIGGAHEDVWFHSPFRTDAKPSFHVYTSKKTRYPYICHDFGGLGSMTLLEFIKALKDVDSKGALKYLRELYPDWRSRVGRISSGKAAKKKNKTQSSFSFPSHDRAEPPRFHNKSEENRNLEFIEDLPLTSKVVLKYLTEGRRIAPEVARQYFRLVKYRNKTKPTQRALFGFGMQNKSGGWEIRSASDEKVFKSALIARDITVVKGTDRSRGVNIFEGQMDFVSLLMMIGTDHLVGDTIILNGLESYGRAKSYIEAQGGYSRIFTFLDNDESGKKTTQKFIEDFGDCVINQSHLYAPYKDINIALKAGHVPQFTASPEPPQP